MSDVYCVIRDSDGSVVGASAHGYEHAYDDSRLSDIAWHDRQPLGSLLFDWPASQRYDQCTGLTANGYTLTRRALASTDAREGAEHA